MTSTSTRRGRAIDLRRSWGPYEGPTGEADCPGLHDFEADLPDGAVAALEVTAEVDDRRLDLASSAERRLSSIALPNSESLWLVRLAATARVNAIRPDDLRRLLSELEASGRRSAHDIP
jgi:hypothetical protein